ncbi:MAG: peptidoglycan-binding protein, partial [Clostridia bacterium]|nr:peptidoglycan-binding protein [Clostridia bacterium]
MALLMGLLPTAALSEQPSSTETYCNMTVTGQHSWGDWTTTKQATCAQAGTRSRTCGRCGYTQTESIPKTGHSWGGWKTTKEATCEKHGEQTRKCSVCGKVETRETDRKPHTWGEWTVITEPTDFSMGTHSHVCQVCGKEKSEDFYPDPTYKKGDKGDGVKDLQEKLNAAGYDCGKADGDFGKKTEAAVKAIEEAHGIKPDGIAWPGVQKWLTEPEAEPAPESAPEEDEDEYGWEPPGDISTFSSPSLPPLPDEATADTYETSAQYSNEKYTFTAYSEDLDGSGLKVGDRARVEATVTNTGTAPLWICYRRFFHGTELISCEPGAKGVWDDGWGYIYYLHLPGESSKWTLEIDREITEKDLADGYITDYAEWRAYPQEYYNGEVTHSIPDDWPYGGGVLLLEHPVFVSLGAPCLQGKVVYYPKAVRTDQEKNLACQVQLSNTGGGLLHNAEADLYLWNKDTGEYTYSKTFPLKDHVFFPKDSSKYVYTLAWGNDIYPVTLWDLENSIDGATRIAYKGRAWTLDGEMFETEITPVEFYPYYVDLWAELAETPEAQTPEGGFVKAKVRVGNDGSDTFDASDISCPIYDPVKDVCYVDDTSEIHGGDLTWLYEGTSQEIEVWVRPTKEEIQAGEARRILTVCFYRWIRNGGRSVYADTPKEEVIGHFDKYYCDEVRTVKIVIPLLAPETESAPEPEPEPTREPVRDACVRKLEGHGDGVAEYTLTYYTAHEQLRESTKLALAIAGDEQEQAIQ